MKNHEKIKSKKIRIEILVNFDKSVRNCFNVENQLFKYGLHLHDRRPREEDRIFPKLVERCLELEL